MATIYKTNGTEVEIQPQNGKDFTLQEMQDIVGGYIEILPIGDYLMVINEEGKLNGLGINKKATDIFLSYYLYSFDIIVGDVLVCEANQII